MFFLCFFLMGLKFGCWASGSSPKVHRAGHVRTWRMMEDWFCRFAYSVMPDSTIWPKRYPNIKMESQLYVVYNTFLWPDKNQSSLRIWGSKNPIKADDLERFLKFCQDSRFWAACRTMDHHRIGSQKIIHRGLSVSSQRLWTLRDIKVMLLYIILGTGIVD